MQTADFSPIFAKVKDAGAQYLILIVSHGASDVLIKQWYDAKVPVPIGGIDVKGMDANFFDRVGGKSIAEVSANFVVRAPLTPTTVAWWDGFVKLYGRPPVYSAPGAYDAVHIYADAVQRAGSTDTDKVIKELEKTDYVACAAASSSMRRTTSRTARASSTSCSCNGRRTANASSCGQRRSSRAR